MAMTQDYSLIEQQTLLQIARESITYGLEHHHCRSLDIDEYSEHLREHAACFVTLQIDHQLRGCIGSLEAHQSLVTDLNQNAFAAAFQDPRFPALSRDEFKSIHLHISVLNQAQPMSFTTEDDLLNQLRVGVDGLIIQDKHRRATFLPAVWESLTDKKQFLTQLKLKAGMTADHWSDNFKAWRYQSFSISEEAL